MWDVLERASEFGYKASTLEVINNFVIMIKMFQSELPKKNAYDLAILVGKNTGIVKELFNDKTTEGLARYENIQELLNSIKEFTETPTKMVKLLDKSLGSYLQQITLLTDADDDKGESDVVKLMTIHAAKGLEFPVVFVGGLEETFFPMRCQLIQGKNWKKKEDYFMLRLHGRSKTMAYLCKYPVSVWKSCTK